MVRSRADKSTDLVSADVEWAKGARVPVPGSAAPPMQGPAEPLMPTTESTAPTTGGTVEQAVRAALATVDDPETHKPITELGMVKGVEITSDGGERGPHG